LSTAVAQQARKMAEKVSKEEEEVAILLFSLLLLFKNIPRFFPSKYSPYHSG
jgi:hypothetical protein